MQDFRDNEEKQFKRATSRPFLFLFLRNLSWFMLVWDLTFCFIFMFQLITVFLRLIGKYHKITQKSKWPLNGNCLCSQKLMWSLTDIAEHICQIKTNLIETSSWNALTSISSLVAVVIKGLTVWGSNCHQKYWYVMAMWSMRKQKLIDQQLYWKKITADCVEYSKQS